MTVDTSREAVDRIAKQLKRDLDWRPGSLCEQAAATLHALLARAEAAGQSARNLSAKADAALREGEMLRRERDAATAERDRLAGLLAGWQSYGCPECNGDCASANPPVALCIVRETLAALASIKKEPTDGE